MKPLFLKPKIPFWEFPDDEKAKNLHQQLRQILSDIFSMIINRRFDLESFDQFVRLFSEATQLHGWALLRFFLSGNCSDPDVTTSSLHTAIVCAIFANQLSWSKPQRDLLIRSTLLHDVGMLFLPAELLKKAGKLTLQERAVIESHPSLSYERVKLWGESFESTQVALQHHEEWSGGGYPQNLQGSEIHPWALLVAVSDNFIARVTERSYRDSLVGYSSIKQLIQEESRFSAKWVRDFISVFGVNPPGGIVLLSDGSVGRVMESNLGQPLRPTIRIMIDRYGHEFRLDHGVIVDLGSNLQLHIARPVNFQDIQNAQIDS